jgi:hypothetical protein
MSAQRKIQTAPLEDNGQLWCLYHKGLGLQLESLKLVEARALLTAWSSEEADLWLCWQEGWTEWHPIATVPQLVKPLSRRTIAPPTMLKTLDEDRKAGDDIIILKEGKEMRAEDFEGTDGIREVTLQDLPPVVESHEFVVREHRRIQRKLKVKIEVSGQVFRSQTVDVSVGGVLLADSMPQWIVGYCRLCLRKEEKNEEVRLLCSVVENQTANDRRRLAMVNLSSEDEKRLLVWLGT